MDKLVLHQKPPRAKRQLFEDGARIEAAFRKYFHRSVDGWRAAYKYERAAKKAEKAGEEAPPVPSYADEEETYDLVVCHGNVIRYSMCRALQLPPNYWLRLATYNCGLTHFQIRATGSVSLFGFGDIGHLDLDQTTYH